MRPECSRIEAGLRTIQSPMNSYCVGSQEASDGGIDRINDALVVIVEGGVEDYEYSS
jgi:hypothetical protein